MAEACRDCGDRLAGVEERDAWRCRRSWRRAFTPSSRPSRRQAWLIRLGGKGSSLPGDLGMDSEHPGDGGEHRSFDPIWGLASTSRRRALLVNDSTTGS